MAIDFIQLLGDDGWEPWTIDPADPAHRLVGGGLLGDAPVDVDATFADGLWRSTRFDPAFKLAGFRGAPGFTMPLRHHDTRMLQIVIGGELTVHEGADGGRGAVSVVTAGQFWVIDANSPYSITAGPHGATFIESSPLLGDPVTTIWHDHGWRLR